VKFQRWFALLTFALFFTIGIIFQSGISDKWVFPLFSFYGLLLAISILTWQYTAPKYAYLIFKIEPPKLRHAFWVSTIILFCLFLVGFYGLTTIFSLSVSRSFQSPAKVHLWIILGVLLFSLLASYNNRKYYR